MKIIPTSRTLAFAAMLSCLGSAALADPCDYANPGEPLWQAISDRYDAGDDIGGFAYYVFTDGENVSVISKSFVAAYESASGNPIKLVTPSPETIRHSSGLEVVSPQTFLDSNSAHVNRVTKSNPVKAGKLNVFVDDTGALTSVAGMGE